MFSSNEEGRKEGRKKGTPPAVFERHRLAIAHLDIIIILISLIFTNFHVFLVIVIKFSRYLSSQHVSFSIIFDVYPVNNPDAGAVLAYQKF